MTACARAARCRSPRSTPPARTRVCAQRRLAPTRRSSGASRRRPWNRQLSCSYACAPNLGDVAGEMRLMIWAERQLIPLDDVGARLTTEQTGHQPEPLEHGARPEVIFDHLVGVAVLLGANLLDTADHRAVAPCHAPPEQALDSPFAIGRRRHFEPPGIF